MTLFYVVKHDDGEAEVITVEEGYPPFVEFTGTYEDCEQYVATQLQAIEYLEKFESSETTRPVDAPDNQDLYISQLEQLVGKLELECHELRESNKQLTKEVHKTTKAYVKQYNDITDLNTKLGNTKECYDALLVQLEETRNTRDEYYKRLDKIESVLLGKI